MQALAERLGAFLDGATFEAADVFGVAGLKTYAPAPTALAGAAVVAVDRRAKYDSIWFGNGLRIVFHLSQAGRVDLEEPAKRTRPKGAVVRWHFSGHRAVLLREHGTERKVGWWLLGPGDEGPLGGLGPEAASDDFAAWLRDSDDARRLHTVLRDQRTVAGIGRGYADDILHRACLSPYAALASLDAGERARLIDAVRAVLDDALARERQRAGGLSERTLGGHFTVHGKAGVPCPACGDELRSVSYASHEVVYCSRCQTGGKVLADRRRSRFVK